MAAAAAAAAAVTIHHGVGVIHNPEFLSYSSKQNTSAIFAKYLARKVTKFQVCLRGLIKIKLTTSSYSDINYYIEIISAGPDCKDRRKEKNCVT